MHSYLDGASTALNNFLMEFDIRIFNLLFNVGRVEIEWIADFIKHRNREFLSMFCEAISQMLYMMRIMGCFRAMASMTSIDSSRMCLSAGKSFTSVSSGVSKVSRFLAFAKREKNSKLEIFWDERKSSFLNMREPSGFVTVLIDFETAWISSLPS